MRALGLAIIAITLTGCDELIGGGACTTSVEPSIRLEIRDSVSGVGLADQATATATDWFTTYTLEDIIDDSVRQYGPYEIGGVFDVVVTVPGYQTWTRENVKVDESGCHVVSVDLLARMVPDLTDATDRPKSE